MRAGLVVVSLGLVAFACAGRASSPAANDDASHDIAAQAGRASSAGECRKSAVFADAGPGACSVANALVDCSGTTGGCQCLSDDPTTCAACTEQLPGSFNCANECAANEYAVSCGGPPNPNSPEAYQQFPSSCRVALSGPGGGQYGCCPCL